jgi:nucleotide-binding universal stress UspA family protein
MAEIVLVPMDDSPGSRRALEFALSTFSDAEVTALHVVDPSTGYLVAENLPSGDVGSPRERGEARGKELLSEAEALAAEHDRGISTIVETGKPARTIVEELGAGHVVMGSHGREGVSRVLLGSVRKSHGFSSQSERGGSDDVAEQVVRRSPTPVSVIR